MKPKNTTTPQDDLLRNRLDNMINNQHKLVKLSQLIDWQSFEDDWGKLFLSDQGAPTTPTRMIAGLHYLKHIYNLSDEQVVERWLKTSTGNPSVANNFSLLFHPFIQLQ